MAVKSKTKSKAKPKTKAKTTVKSKAAKTKSVKKITKAVKVKAVKTTKPKTAKTAVSKPKTAAKAPAKKAVKTASAPKPVMTVVKRTVGPRASATRRTLRPNQYSYMNAPGSAHGFEVGDTVEVFCDHEKSRERVRGWIKGIVVQVDYKMVAVQFRSNVFLTDGWMVPDRILWYPLNSEHIRALPGKKSAAKKELIPDY
jgi:hypothetical protein